MRSFDHIGKELCDQINAKESYLTMLINSTLVVLPEANNRSPRPFFIKRILPDEEIPEVGDNVNIVRYYFMTMKNVQLLLKTMVRRIQQIIFHNPV